MKLLEDLVLKCNDYEDCMTDYVACICYEINKIKANYPEADLDVLVSSLSALMMYCDTVLTENYINKNRLETSLSETAVLVTKLNKEKTMRELDINRSAAECEVRCDENIALKNELKKLKYKLHKYEEDIVLFKQQNKMLTDKVHKIKLFNESLTKIDIDKENIISNLKLQVNAITNECVVLQNHAAWDRNKWVSDDIINDYFSAMTATFEGSNNEVLFLGPASTLIIKLGTSSSAMESLNLTSFNVSKYVFLCLTDCTDASKEDNGSHWSLLFLNRLENKAYHLDSMTPLNKEAAKTVATKLGVKFSDVVEMPCIQQQKSFECGIHVLVNAMHIAVHYCQKYQTDVSFYDWFLGDIKNAYYNQQNPNAPTQNTFLSEVPEVNYDQPTLSTYLNGGKKSLKIRRRPKLKSRNNNIVLKNKFEVLDKVELDDYTAECVPVPSIKNQTAMNKGTVKPKYTCTSASSSTLHNINKPKLTVLCDSQGRNLSTFLDYINDKFEVYNFCQPGAPLQTIMKEMVTMKDIKTYSKKDTIVLIGGTNNIPKLATSNKKSLIKSLAKYIEDQLPLLNHTNLILATIPYRYDLDAGSPENEVIKEININIRSMIYNRPHIKLLDLYLLQSNQHTRHGLHINRKGKKTISKEIIKMTEHNILQANAIITESAACNTTGSTSNLTEIVTLHSTIPTIDPDTSSTASDRQITVIEANMQDVINSYRQNPNIAFAHCISEDFNDKRHMSAGVALTFRKTFNRPKKEDSITKHLTFQDNQKQASVYGLVTKPTFHSKPTESDYNNAFSDFASHFIHSKFEKLICSPLGCIRDQILPEVFAKNIVSFQRRTKVPVSVIVSDERASRTLRNGLKHQEFVTLLRSSIAMEESLQSGSKSNLQPRHPDGASCNSVEARVSSSGVDRGSTPELRTESSPCSQLVPGHLDYSESVRSTPVSEVRGKSKVQKVNYDLN